MVYSHQDFPVGRGSDGEKKKVGLRKIVFPYGKTGNENRARISTQLAARISIISEVDF